MDPQDLSASANRLLSALPERTLASLAPLCRRVRLLRGEVLSVPDHPISTAHFVESGVASVVKHDGHVDRIEICLIGRNNFCGTPLVIGDGRWPYETFVQADDLTAVAVEAAPLSDRLAADAELRRVLLRAVYVQMVQVAEGVVSAVSQRLLARVARWLLMYRDEFGSDRLELTHEFMAIMVGAQRTGVTAALHELEGEGLIAAQRGLVILRDRAALERIAGGGYGVAEREQQRLLSADHATPAR